MHYNLYKCTVQSVEAGGQVGKLALNPVNEQGPQSTVMSQLVLENSNLLFILVAKGCSLGGQWVVLPMIEYFYLRTVR